MTRVGFMVECARDGADHKVIDHVVRRLRPDVDPVFAFLGSKRNLLTDGPSLVAGLLTSDHCARVFVVWDLIPCDLPDPRGSPCRRNERAALLAALTREGVDLSRVTLVCITYELEAWLLADGAAITAVLERPTHPIKKIKSERRPEEHPNPKKTLQKLFKEHRGKDYLDARHAIEIVKNVTDLGKLESAPSFARFAERLRGV